ncbi:MAG: PhoU domain-containing protein [Halobacteriaceae archaeon]
MEQRKVQMTGGSTYTVSIPKSWARDNDVSTGDEVSFYEENDTLLLSTATADETSEGTLDISGLDGEALTRMVLTMYVSGFDVMRLEADRISAEQRRLVREATQSLVGLEVMEETATEIVIQDLLDSSELSVHSAVRRMRLIAMSMIDDAITALTSDDDDIATDVIGRDDDVDRLWFVVSRIFRGSLRSPRAAREIGVTRDTCFDYHTTARQLERIADHGAKIAELATDLETVPTPVVDAIEDLDAEAEHVVQTALDAMFTDDADEATRLANEALDRAAEIDGLARSADDAIRTADVDPFEAQHLGLVVDSLSRTGDYGGNIAETALQNAAPSPAP